MKERLEKETAAHLETKQRISELEYHALELDRQVSCERGERHRLERLVSSGSLPDDAKVNCELCFKTSMTNCSTIPLVTVFF